MSGRRFLLTLTILAASTVVADEPSVLEIANRFWSAYSRGDVQEAAGLWTPTGFSRDRFIHETEARCLDVIDSSLRIVRRGDDSVTVAVDATTARWPATDAGTLRVEEEHFEMELRRDRGDWKVGGWTHREDRLAEEIAQSSERDALLERNRELRTPRLAMALSRCAVRMVNQERFADAAAILTQARRIADETQDDRALSSVLGSESVLLRRKFPSQLDESLHFAEEAERIAMRSQDIDAITLVRVQLGRVLEFSDPLRAEAMLLDLIALSPAVPDPTSVAKAASQLARMCDDRLEHARALRFSVIASHYAELSGDTSARLSAALNLGGAYLYGGTYDLSARHYELALSLARKTGSVRAAADAFIQLLNCYRMLDETKARGNAMLAEAIDAAACAGTESKEIRIELLILHAQLAAAEGRRQIAQKDLATAYALARRGPDELLVVSVLMREVELLIEERLPARALEALAEAHAIVAILPWQFEQDAAQMSARALVMLGRRHEAEAELRRAIGLSEAERSTFAPDPTTRQNYLRAKAGIYHELVALLVDSGKTEEAFRVADRLTARTLREGLASEGSVGKSAEILQAERRIVQLNRTLLSAHLSATDLAAEQQHLKRARMQLDELRAQKASGLMETPVLSEKRPDLDAIPPRSAVVQFVVLKDRTIVFVARSRATMTATTLPISRSQLEREVIQLRTRTAQRDLRYFASASAMYRRLIAPLVDGIRDVERLFLIPDGPLWLLPFQALCDDKRRYLVDRFEITYAPSLSWVVGRQSSSKVDSVLAVGDPEIGATTRATVRSLFPGRELGALPDAAREAREVAKLYRRTRVMIGSDAQESAIKEAVSGYDVVHLATHAFLEQAQPMYSSIVLAASDDGDEDGLLEVREVESLHLHAQLIVLSACSTASGRVVTGEGVVGLAWAFLSRGVPRVVASQWQADSESTATLMVRFHRYLVEGDRPAAALRKAQRELRRDPRYDHPYYWAAFTVVGAS